MIGDRAMAARRCKSSVSWNRNQNHELEIHIPAVGCAALPMHLRYNAVLSLGPGGAFSLPP